MAADHVLHRTARLEPSAAGPFGVEVQAGRTGLRLTTHNAVATPSTARRAVAAVAWQTVAELATVEPVGLRLGLRHELQPALAALALEPERALMEHPAPMPRTSGTGAELVARVVGLRLRAMLPPPAETVALAASPAVVVVVVVLRRRRLLLKRRPEATVAQAQTA